MAALKSFAGVLAQSYSRSLLCVPAKRSPSLLAACERNSHTIHRENPENKIVLIDNGATIVCWHPAPEFPYECSLPLPVQTTDVNQVLKSTWDDVREAVEIRKPQFEREYLMKVTATTKHRWFPRLGKKFAKKTKPDREFL